MGEMENRDTAKTGVVNVSDKTLTSAEESLLSKGIKFCPTPLYLDKLALQRDLDAFKRRLRLFEFFNAGSENEEKNSETPRFRNKSTWTPREGRDSFLDCFLDAIQKDVDEFQPPKYVKDNLPKEEREALTNLRYNKDIVIKPEDKGPAFVLQNTTAYIHTATSDLKNGKIYRKNAHDKTPETVEKVTNIAAKMLREGDIDKHTAEYLVPGEVKTSRYYTLPKTHKDTDADGHLKTRPVISGSGSPIERLSEFVDFYINPEMKKLDSFVKDSKDVLKLINSINNNGPLSHNIAMFTIDVKAMYPSLPQHLGIEGVRRALETRETKIPSTSNLIDCLKICLEENHFEFNGEFFTQIHGTSIGPKMAPGYACLGMGLVEERLWETCTLKPIQWCRYIDDIWGLWPHGQDAFISFMGTLNNLYPGELEFTWEFEFNSISFLDIRIKRTEEGYLNTDLFVKPTFKNLYLQYDSYHSRHTLDNIAYGQALRIKAICSEEDDLQKNLQNLQNNLGERGYPISKISEGINKATRASRNRLLNSELATKKHKHIVAPLVTTRNPRLPPLSQIIKKHFPILQLSKTFLDNFHQPPTVIYRQPPNIRSLLVRAKISRNINADSKGCFKTHSKRCVTCTVLKDTDLVQSSSTGQKFKIRQDITCTTVGSIYLINCHDCNKQYVGETGGELRIRHHGHRQEMRKANTPLGKHFQVCKNYELIGIEKIRNNTKKIREEVELNWIYRLNTFAPVGINVKDVSHSY